MPIIHRIRERVIDRDYFLSAHAEEEMWADDLERLDVENALLKGRIERRMTRDPRGARYRIEGPAIDGRLLHVVCRFDRSSALLLITVYALAEET